jgi:hypothetical protein
VQTNFGGAPMNAVVLRQPRELPATRNFGWGWLRAGRRWKVKTSGSLDEINPARRSDDSPKRRGIDDLKKTSETLYRRIPAC